MEGVTGEDIVMVSSSLGLVQSAHITYVCNTKNCSTVTRRKRMDTQMIIYEQVSSLIFSVISIPVPPGLLTNSGCSCKTESHTEIDYRSAVAELYVVCIRGCIYSQHSLSQELLGIFSIIVFRLHSLIH